MDIRASRGVAGGGAGMLRGIDPSSTFGDDLVARQRQLSAEGSGCSPWGILRFGLDRGGHRSSLKPCQPHWGGKGAECHP